MSKHVIREDELGLYVRAGGYVSRPATASTVSRHKVGDKVNAYHSGGPVVSVGDERWWIVSDEDDPAGKKYLFDRGLTGCLNCGYLRASHPPTFKGWRERGCDSPVYP